MMTLKFNLRPAATGDAEFVFRLSNDRTVRRNSVHSGEIRWEDHVAWFARMLTSPDCIFFIVELEGEPIGQIRFNRSERGWECSASLLEQWRGKGLSPRFVRAALIRSGLPEALAMTRVSNDGAIRTLRDSGYEFVRNETQEGGEYEVYRYRDRVFTIAEMSANHRGDLERAKEIVAAAAASGADAVKLEGGSSVCGLIKRLTTAGIPVLAHVGMTPQSVNEYGGFKKQGKTREAAEKVLADAKAVEQAGAFAVTLECIPSELAAEITAAVKIPTIGIGAGPVCDAQWLVMHDLLGLNEKVPSFVKKYANLADTVRSAFSTYVKEVKTDEFPGQERK